MGPGALEKAVHYLVCELPVAVGAVFILLVYFPPLNQRAVSYRVQQPLNHGLSHDCSPGY